MYSLISLSVDEKSKIASLLPGQINQVTAQWLSITPPEWIDHITGPSSNLSVALICLRDAVDVALAVDFSLFMAKAYLLYFSEYKHQKEIAIDYCKFFADDAALRLYAAGEHCANFIINDLGLEKKDYAPFNQKNYSLAVSIGRYLTSNLPEHYFTLQTKLLLERGNWGRVINYRNDWVHSQPPLIERPNSIGYKRHSRWRKINNVWELAIGGDTWDRPDIKIEELLDLVINSEFALEKYIKELSDYFFRQLEPKITRNLETGELIPVNLFN